VNSVVSTAVSATSVNAVTAALTALVSYAVSLITRANENPIRLIAILLLSNARTLLTLSLCVLPSTHVVSLASTAILPRPMASLVSVKESPSSVMGFVSSKPVARLPEKSDPYLGKFRPDLGVPRYVELSLDPFDF